MSVQQLDQATNRFGTTKVGDFLNSHTSPDGSQLIDGGGITINESYDISEGTLNGATVTLEGDVTAHIPDGVITISDNAFMNNTDITKVIMPNSVTSIGSGTFSGCTGLESVIIQSNSLIEIGNNAFYGCTSLTDIYYAGTQTEWSQITIGTDAIPAGATIHYEYTPE